jgi:arylsulfatase A-like enzyme
MRVLLVDIDSLRPDHLGCYGYGRDTSPTLDRLAAEGVAFDRCFVSDSPCLPSRTALATGRHGLKSGVVTHFGSGQWYDEPGEGHSPDPDRPLGFRYLSENGVHTASISGFSKRHLAYHFGVSFRESIQPTAQTGGEQASDITPVALDWLDRHAAEDDWLLHVNYWDVHHPYSGIDDVVEEVRDSGPAAPWPDRAAIDAQRGVTGPRSADLWPDPDRYRDAERRGGLVEHGEWGMPVRVEDRGDVEHILDGYDASIRKVDAHVRLLLGALEDAGVREETAVVVTADHGEALGEHGIYAEHAFAHSPCQRVPMIVSWPGVTDDRPGGRVDANVYQFDLMATLCDLAGVEVPAGWDAEPFTGALRGEGFPGRDHLVCGHGIYTFSRAVYRDDWAYIRVLHPGVMSHPGLFNDPDLPGAGLELLHDLDEDPHATRNLIADRPDVADEMRSLHDSWVVEASSSRDAAGEDPLARMAAESGPFLYVDPDDLAALYRDLGRSDEQIAAVERAREFPPGP